VKRQPLSFVQTLRFTLSELAKVAFDVNDPVVAGIINAATAEFSQFGLGGARLERIIANTHTSKRMVYYHFGSKIGLYKAVLEHTFESVRLREQHFDPEVGSPLQALAIYAENAFDSFVERPDFVRLLTFENLSGAPYMNGSALISKLNQRGLSHVERVLSRGRSAGEIRGDVSALDVFMNLVGLSYYHVANYAGYVSGGFSTSVEKQLAGQEFQAHRRAMVVEATVRFVSSTRHYY
jgi:AcrR family transcriptional regulator